MGNYRDWFDNPENTRQMVDDIDREVEKTVEIDIDKREKTAEEAEFRNVIILQNKYRENECDKDCYIRKIDHLLMNTPSVELRSVFETDNFNETDTIIALWFGLDYEDFPSATSVFRFLSSLAYIIEPRWNDVNAKIRQSENPFNITIGKHTPYDQGKDWQQVTLSDLKIIKHVMTGQVPQLQSIDIQRLHTLVSLFMTDEAQRTFTLNEVLDFELSKNLIHGVLWHGDFTVTNDYEYSTTFELNGKNSDMFRGISHETNSFIEPLSEDVMTLMDQRAIVPDSFINDSGMRIYIDALSERWLSADKDPDWNQQVSHGLSHIVYDYISRGRMRFRGHLTEIKPTPRLSMLERFSSSKQRDTELEVFIVYIGMIEDNGRLYDVCLYKPLMQLWHITERTSGMHHRC